MDTADAETTQSVNKTTKQQQKLASYMVTMYQYGYLGRVRIMLHKVHQPVTTDEQKYRAV